MLYRTDVVHFFETHELIPGRDSTISYKSYLLLLFDALALDEVLYSFCKESFTIDAYGNVNLNFDCWAEMISCYTSFFIGFTKKDRSCELPM